MKRIIQKANISLKISSTTKIRIMNRYSTKISNDTKLSTKFEDSMKES